MSSDEGAGRGFLKLVCPNCNAPLIEQQLERETITCAHCGAAFKQPSNEAGSVSVITGPGGKIAVHGHVIGGDAYADGQRPQAGERPNAFQRGSINLRGQDIQIRGHVVGGDFVAAPSLGQRLRAWLARLLGRRAG